MQIKELGHVVLYVSNLEKMSHFYRNILGFKEISNNGQFAAFSSGRTHHEMLLIDISRYVGDKSFPKMLQPGLYHIGFKVGDSDAELREAYEVLKGNNIPISGTADHHVSHSIYTQDPDGNELELYIDTDVDWKNNPELITKPPTALNFD